MNPTKLRQLLFVLLGVASASAQGVQSVEATAAQVAAGTVGAPYYVSPRRLAGGGGPGVFSSVTDSGLTAGRVTFAGNGGLLSDDADLTFATDTLTFTRGIVPTSLIIGAAAGSSPSTTFQVVDTGTATPRGITNSQYSTGTESAQFNAMKARGTFASPTTIVTGDLLGRFIAWGHDGSNFINTGDLRFTSEGTIAATRVPSKFEIFVSTNAAPSVSTLTAAFSGKDGIALTALGTNQNITLTPSGSGGVLGVSADTSGNGIFQAKDTNASGYSAFVSQDTTGTLKTSIGYANSTVGLTTLRNSAYFFSPTGVPIVFYANSADSGRFVGTHLLLGGLTTDGTGVLQFPAATANTGGINFGTEIFFFRTGTNTAQITASSGLTVSGPLAITSGITYSNYNGQTGATYSIAATDTAVTLNHSGGTTVTLGSAVNGRTLFLRTISADAVISASSNVVPLVGGSAGTAILAATAGKWATLMGDGTNWQIIAGN